MFWSPWRHILQYHVHNIEIFFSSPTIVYTIHHHHTTLSQTSLRLYQIQNSNCIDSYRQNDRWQFVRKLMAKRVVSVCIIFKGSECCRYFERRPSLSQYLSWWWCFHWWGVSWMGPQSLYCADEANNRKWNGHKSATPGSLALVSTVALSGIVT